MNIQTGVKQVARMFGLDIRRIQKPVHTFDRTFERLQLLQELGFEPQVICDVGAAVGNWSRQCLTIFPSAQYFCIEPLDENQAELVQLCAEYPNVDYWQGCLGAKPDKVTLNADGVGSSILGGHWGNAYGIPVKTVVDTLDNLIAQEVCPTPTMLKLDVQGYEIETLKGSQRALIDIQVVVAEVSFFQFQKGMPVLHEVVGMMANYGFIVFDILSLSTRPLDGASAQTDLLFLKDNHPFLEDCRWDSNSVY